PGPGGAPPPGPPLGPHPGRDRGQRGGPRRAVVSRGPYGRWGSVREMEAVDWDGISDGDAGWAALRLRAVAHLAEALPAEPELGGHELQRLHYVYGPDAAQDDEAYQAWLALGARQRRAERAATERKLARLADRPSVSVV